MSHSAADEGFVERGPLADTAIAAADCRREVQCIPYTQFDERCSAGS